MAPPKKLKALVTSNLTVKRAALSMFDGADFIDKGAVTKAALKVVAGYRERFAEGDTKAEAVAGKELLVNRVQNVVVQQIAEGIQEEYDGEFYIWLPSSATTPDPEHQLNYGKKFQVGEGEMPGDRYGCRCGMKILVKETVLAL